MNKLKKDNSGFSLAELLIVIAILTIMTGFISYGFGLISTKPALTCTRNLEVSLQRARTTTLGKRSGRISIYQGSDGVYILEEYDYAMSSTPMSDLTGSVRVGDESVTVTAAGAELTSSGITVVFNRSDGSVSSGSSNFPIVVTKGARSYTISINRVTGAVSVQ